MMSLGAMGLAVRDVVVSDVRGVVVAGLACDVITESCGSLCNTIRKGDIIFTACLALLGA